MMNILSHTGNDDLAKVFTASYGEDTGKLVEFVDARDPALSRDEKWVIIVSTQFGCPIACRMCDSGGGFKGNLSSDQIVAQIDHVIAERQNDRTIRSKKFKIQFARMGEPALNPSVLDVLRVLPRRYNASGLIPCIATTMPKGTDRWFEDLIAIKQTVYPDHLFQLQISINSTDEGAREWLMPYPKWSFHKMAEYGDHFICSETDRKIALNFAWTRDVPIEPEVIARLFNPRSFCIKITPLNPTITANKSELASAFDPDTPNKAKDLCNEFHRLGYETILSIGDIKENEIGSNCGMSIKKLSAEVF